MQVGAIYGVMQFYNILRAGISWKGPEIIELWYQKAENSDFDDDDDAGGGGEEPWPFLVTQISASPNIQVLPNSAKAAKTKILA